MRTIKRMLCALLALCVTLTLLPAVVSADGGFIVSGDTGYTYSGGVLTIISGGEYKVEMTNGVTTTSDRIVIGTSGAVVVTLTEVNINTDAGPAIDCGSSGNVTLVLAGENKCLTTNSDAAAIHLVSGAALEIRGDGSLEARNEASINSVGAGIGGGNDESCGEVTINGGTVTASGNFGAGIGGGFGGSGGTVTVYSGTVTASSEFGAGIGGGYVIGNNGSYGRGSALTVSGGTVTASSKFSAGIGGGCGANGNGGDGGTVMVSGGVVIAQSINAECIGGGKGSGTGSDGAFGSLTFKPGAGVMGISCSLGSGINAVGAPTKYTNRDGTTLNAALSAKCAYIAQTDSTLGNLTRSSFTIMSQYDRHALLTLLNFGWEPACKTIINRNMPLFETYGGKIKNAIIEVSAAMTNGNVATVANDLREGSELNGVAVFAEIYGISTDATSLSFGGFAAACEGSIKNSLCTLLFSDDVRITTYYDKDGNPSVIEGVENITKTLNDNLIGGSEWNIVTVSGTSSNDGQYSHHVGESVGYSAGTKDDNVFLRWSTDGVALENNKRSEATFIMPDNDVTLTAVWTYYLLTVSGTSSDGRSKRATDSTITRSAGTKAGYVFSHWTATGITLADDTAKEITFDMPENDVVLTAVWTKAQTYNPPSASYKLTFAVNGGTAIAPLSASVYSYINLDAYVPTKAGDTFEGWYSDPTLKNKISSITLGCDTTVYAKWRGGSMENFKLASEYSGYTDVNGSAWYAEACRGATMLGLMRGTATVKKTFSPTASITLAEVIKLASVISRTYSGTSPAELAPAGTWYAPYVKYAIEAGIISASDFGGNYTRTATRAETVYILANALPASEFAKISNLTPPDVADADKYSAEINLLYAAGILRGCDSVGTFKGANTLTRAEAAAICVRICLPNKRV